VISDDLTSNDPAMQTFRESGGLTPDVTHAENYTTIVAVAPSPLERGTIWVGTDDGRIHVTRDGGESWKRIDRQARNVPGGAWVPMITPSPHDPGTAFVVFDDHRRSDMKPYVYRVEDYGNDWNSLVTEDLSGYALSILQDPKDPNLLFLGTEFGLWVSIDAGRSWTKFTAGVPTVSVMDMAIQERENDLVLGTHGRSFYVLDDYSALRGLSESDFSNRLKILSTSPGQKYQARQTPSTRFTGSGEFRAENEPYGVMVTFIASGDDLPHPDEEIQRELSIARRASEPPKTDEDENSIEDKLPRVEMRVTNDAGETIRTRRFPVHRGINRVVWQMDHDGVRPMPGPEPADLEDGLPGGPEIPSGTYQISLRLDPEDSGPVESSAPVSVLPDPRSNASPETENQIYQARMNLLALQETSVTAVERIVSARNDVDTVVKLIASQPRAQEDESLRLLGKQAIEVKKGLIRIEKRFRSPPQTRGITYRDEKIVNMIQRADAYMNNSFTAPGDTADIYAELARQALDTAVEKLNRFIKTDLAAFIKAADEAGIGLFRSTTPIDSGSR
jgi:hypothetical protein